MDQSPHQATPALASYIIQGSREDAVRLNLLSQALAPSTSALLDRVPPLKGKMIIDAACGSGGVTLELARRAGKKGHVFAFDADAGKLAAAAELAESRGISNVTFMQADATQRWPVGDVAMVYARFILTHLPRPLQFLERAMDSLTHGGVIAVEDIDVDGCFWHPASTAMQKLRDTYAALSRLRRCDPCIGRRLDELLGEAGFSNVQTTLVHPYGRIGPAKQVSVMSLNAIKGNAVSAGLMPKAEFESLFAELEAFAARRDTMISMPRVFQAWGSKE